MARVFWDTNVFIYLFEKNPEWSDRVVDLRRKMVARKDELLTSMLTVGEILTKPRESGDAMLEKSYLSFFTRGPVSLITFDLAAARPYAEIRSQNRVRPADAIQLACAAGAPISLSPTTSGSLAWSSTALHLSAELIDYLTDLAIRNKSWLFCQLFL